MEVVEEQELTKVEEVVSQFLIEELKSDAYESERNKLVILVWSPGHAKAQQSWVLHTHDKFWGYHLFLVECIWVRVLACAFVVRIR